MKYSLATAISIILLGSSLTSALVIQRQSASAVTVQFKTGDGDSSIQQSFTPGKLTTTNTNGSPIGGAVNGEIVEGDDKCQFFSDAKGTIKVGGVLSSTDLNPTQFTDASDGGTGSVASDAVTLGSVCCANSAAFDSQCGSFGSSRSSTSSSSSATVFPVTIQINGLSEQATQGEILADGKPHVLAAPLIGSDALSADVIHTHKAVACQAFDVAGSKLGGDFKVADEADFGVATGVTVATVSCTQL